MPAAAAAGGVAMHATVRPTKDTQDLNARYAMKGTLLCTDVRVGC